jgi:putative PEP-CTERM system TPR-repeat lipoprotein
MSNEEPEKALLIVKELLVSQPKAPEVYDLAGSIYLALGKEDEALSHFKQSNQADPQYISALHHIASLYLFNNDIELAKNYARKLLKVDVKNIQGLELLSTIEERSGNMREAISWLEKSVAQGTSMKSNLHLVKLLTNNHQLNAASNHIKKIRQKHPDNLFLLDISSDIDIKNNNIDRAKLTHKKMVTIARQSKAVLPLVEIAKKQMLMNDPKSAQVSLGYAVDIAPNNSEVIAAIIQFDLAQGNYRQAFNRASLLVEQFPENEKGYLLAAKVCALMDRVECAKSWYIKGLNLIPDNEAFALNYYKLLQSDEGVKKSIVFLENWIVTQKPLSLLSVRSLAAGLAMDGQYEKATKIYEKLLISNPDDVLSLNNLAILYSKNSDDRALDVARQAYTLSPQASFTIDTYGWLLTLAGNHREGLPLLQKATTLEGNNLEVRYHYAVSLHKSNRPKTAARELEAILSTGQNFDGIEDAQSLLSAIRLSNRQASPSL